MKKLFVPFLSACKKSNYTPTDFVLTVNIENQSSDLFQRCVDKITGTQEYIQSKIFSCSTSRFGIGEVAGSNCTPRGLHRIAEKVGAGEPAGTAFKSRQIVGHTSQPEFANAPITTRIMWLEGLEPGFNRGGNVDSHDRYIYIHGTANQAGIGRPASHGCVHFSDPDLIELFDLLPSGTLVWISEN